MRSHSDLKVSRKDQRRAGEPWSSPNTRDSRSRVTLRHELTSGWPSFTTRPYLLPLVSMPGHACPPYVGQDKYAVGSRLLSARQDPSFYYIVTRGGDLTVFWLIKLPARSVVSPSMARSRTDGRRSVMFVSTQKYIPCWNICPNVCLRKTFNFAILREAGFLGSCEILEEKFN